MKPTDLPPDASAELSAIYQTNQHLQRLAVYLTSELNDVQVMLTIQREMLRLVLINAGMDPDDLDKILNERAAEWRKVVQSASRVRWEAAALDSEFFLDVTGTGSREE